MLSTFVENFISNAKDFNQIDQKYLMTLCYILDIYITVSLCVCVCFVHQYEAHNWARAKVAAAYDFN